MRKIIEDKYTALFFTLIVLGGVSAIFIEDKVIASVLLVVLFCIFISVYLVEQYLTRQVLSTGNFIKQKIKVDSGLVLFWIFLLVYHYFRADHYIDVMVTSMFLIAFLLEYRDKSKLYYSKDQIVYSGIVMPIEGTKIQKPKAVIRTYQFANNGKKYTSYLSKDVVNKFENILSLGEIIEKQHK